jgi:hypothetical protein
MSELITSGDFKALQLPVVRKGGFDQEKTTEFLKNVEKSVAFLENANGTLRSDAAMSKAANEKAKLEINKHLETINVLQEQLQAKLEAVEIKEIEVSPTDKSFRVLELAEKVLEDAKNDAALILENAKKEKAELQSQAAQDAEDLISNARELHRSEFESMDAERADLEAVIQELHNHAQKTHTALLGFYEDRLKSLVPATLPESPVSLAKELEESSELATNNEELASSE